MTNNTRTPTKTTAMHSRTKDRGVIGAGNAIVGAVQIVHHRANIAVVDQRRKTAAAVARADESPLCALAHQRVHHQQVPGLKGHHVGCTARGIGWSERRRRVKLGHRHVGNRRGQVCFFLGGGKGRVEIQQ